MAVALPHLRLIGPEEHYVERSAADILQEYAQTAHLGEAESSRQTYLRHARLFLEWLAQEGRPLGHVDADVVAAWRRHAESQGYRPATLALKLVSVRKLLVWAQERGYTARLDELDLVTRTKNGQKTSLAPPRVHAEPVRYLDFPELEKLLAAPFAFVRKDGSLRDNALRDAVILSLLALRGLREGELRRAMRRC